MNKVAIITGASSGIGRETAFAFARLGHQLSLAGRNKERLDETARHCIELGLPKEQVLVVTGDIEVEEDIRTLVEKTSKHFGTVDILINNAGYANEACEFKSTDISNMDAMYRVHVRSVFLLTRMLLPYLIKTKGNVINISSLASKMPLSMDTAYSVAKAAQNHLTRCIALEMAKEGVRVNTICPTFTETNIDKRIGISDSQKYYDLLAPTHPMQRIAKTDDIVNAIVFLSSDKAAFITGECLNVDGGMALTHKEPDGPLET